MFVILDNMFGFYRNRGGDDNFFGYECVGLFNWCQYCDD